MTRTKHLFSVSNLWFLFFACCIGVVLLTPNIVAQIQKRAALPTTITLTENDDFAVDVGLHAVFMTEQGQELSLQGALQSNDWVPINLALIDGARARVGGTSTAPYNIGVPTWVHFKTDNNTPVARTIILDTQRPDLRNIQIYQMPIGSNSTQILDQNDRQVFRHRAIKNTELAAKITVEPNSGTSIYMRYIRTASEPMHLKLFAPAAYEKKVRHKSVWIAAFLSVLATIVLITLLGLPALGWRIALSYVFYVSMVGLWFAGVTGHFFSIVTPDFPIIGYRAVEVFAALMFAAFLNMGRVLFRYKEISVNYNRLLVTVIFANVICAVLILFVDIYDSPPLAYTTLLLMLLSCMLYVSNAIIAVKAKRYGASAMLVGSISLFVSIGIYRYVTMAVNAGELIIPIGRFILIPPISFIEISCFAIAMIQGQIGIRRQRDKAQKSEMAAIEEQLRLSSALQDSEISYQKAQRKAEIRRQRLSSVSHDLLQPLASLRTTLGEAKRMDDSKAQQMHDAFNYLEMLARESLSSSVPDENVEADAVQEEFEITAVTDNVYAMFKDEAKIKGLDFLYDATDFNVRSHPVELMRIVSNLVSNAIKHTDEGSVNLNCHIRDGVKTITVQDTGSGMSKAEVQTYLKAYKKGSSSSGTGLGLYQVKMACESLGHTFTVSSKIKEGTTAHILFSSPLDNPVDNPVDNNG